MDVNASISDIIATASQLDTQELNTLLGELNALRSQRTTAALSKQETELLKYINTGFPQSKWERLAELDNQMELSDLSAAEATESLALASDLETYTVQRFEYLKQLALIRNLTVEQLMVNLGIAPH
jgi:hypothetical protein